MLTTRIALALCIACAIPALIPADPAGSRESAFFAAVAGGDGHAVRAALAADKTLARELDADGYTALHRAAFRGKTNVVAILLDAGADPNAGKDPDLVRVRPDDGDTPLHAACYGDAGRVVPLLLARGADFTRRNRAGFTPLVLAQKLGAESAELALRRAGAAPEAMFRRDVVAGKVEQVAADLAARPGWLTLRGVDERTPVESAVRAGQANMVELLVKLGVSPDTLDSTGTSLLYLAAYDGHANVVVALLNFKANPNLRSHGQTPLHVAAARGHAGIVTLLVANGADRAAVDATGRTPLVLARAAGHARVVRLLE